MLLHEENGEYERRKLLKTRNCGFAGRKSKLALAVSNSNGPDAGIRPHAFNNHQS